MRRESPQDSDLERLVDLLKKYEPEKIILFGSRARGDADAFSDYDVLLIKRTDRFWSGCRRWFPIWWNSAVPLRSWFTLQKNSNR